MKPSMPRRGRSKVRQLGAVFFLLAAVTAVAADPDPTLFRADIGLVISPMGRLVELEGKNLEQKLLAEDSRILQVNVSGSRRMTLTDAQGRSRTWTNSPAIVRLGVKGPSTNAALAAARSVGEKLLKKYSARRGMTAEILEPPTNARPVTFRYDSAEPTLQRVLKPKP